MKNIYMDYTVLDSLLQELYKSQNIVHTTEIIIVKYEQRKQN